MRRIASGFGLVEGPRVDGKGNLYFADVTKGGVYRRTPGGEVELVVPRRRGVGGIALHARGGLVISGRDVCHVRDGSTRILFERPEGVGGFNDLFTDAQGRVYLGRSARTRWAQRRAARPVSCIASRARAGRSSCTERCA